MPRRRVAASRTVENRRLNAFRSPFIRLPLPSHIHHAELQGYLAVIVVLIELEDHVHAVTQGKVPIYPLRGVPVDRGPLILTPAQK
jgi:hypothetical protein